MKFRERLSLSWKVLTSDSWHWRTGSRAPQFLFSGEKFRGSLLFPSLWDQDTDALRARSRKSYWDSVQARALVGRIADNTIGTGLQMEASPVWEIIGDKGTSEEKKHQIVREIELRFDLWANSHEPDATDRKNFYELQDYEFINRLRDGETFIIIRYSGDTSRQSPISLQFIDPGQVYNPTDGPTIKMIKDSGRIVQDGIEIDVYGKEIAIYVYDWNLKKHSRIPIFGSNGRRYVIHPMITDQIGARRGTPILASVVHELEKITDYTVAELEAAIINAILAVWIEPSQTARASDALAGIRTRDSGGRDSGGVDDPKEASFDKPGLIVQTLRAGEKVQSFDTKRPNVNFGEFVKHITKHLSASLGVPLEVLEESFNANYSASRASLLLFWTKVEKWREETASQFLNHVYKAWFSEEVKSKRLHAPGYEGSSPAIRAAWTNCEWLGINKPSIDPYKEANAVDVRIKGGLTTRERETLAFNGSDYRENVEKLRVENELLAEANERISKIMPSSGRTTEDGDNEE